MSKVKKFPDVLSLDDIKKYKDHLTIGELKKIIANIPDDGKILIERIEDVYYENNHWGVVLKEGESYLNAKKWNENIDSETYKNNIKYPNAENTLRKYSEKELEAEKTQYHPAFCVSTYKDDDNNLYINLHY
jgi:hypothetical protein